MKANRRSFTFLLLLGLFSFLFFTTPGYVQCPHLYPDEFLDISGILYDGPSPSPKDAVPLSFLHMKPDIFKKNHCLQVSLKGINSLPSILEVDLSPTLRF